MNIAQRALVLAGRVYQWTLSPILAAAIGPSARCRFRPTCSEYAIQSVQLHGAVKGSWLAVKRLARCHPWGQFGDDPPPPRVHERGCCHHG